MKWYIEIFDGEVKAEDFETSGNYIKTKRVIQYYFGEKPRKSKYDDIKQIEISNPPNDFNYQPWYEVDFTDETKTDTDIEWKVNRNIWLNEYVRPTREPLMQKALNKIDQYKNETEQLEKGIITERSISDTQYQEWLTYLQDLKDITDTIEYGNEQWPEGPK